MSRYPDGAIDDWAAGPNMVRTTASFVEPMLGEAAAAAPRPQGRRLSDKILVAFHHACDLGDFEVAQDLLHVLEVILSRKTMPQHLGRRRNMESLVAAHERLWQLRNPEDDA